MDDDRRRRGCALLLRGVALVLEDRRQARERVRQEDELPRGGRPDLRGAAEARIVRSRPRPGEDGGARRTSKRPSEKARHSHFWPRPESSTSSNDTLASAGAASSVLTSASSSPYSARSSSSAVSVAAAAPAARAALSSGWNEKRPDSSSKMSHWTHEDVCGSRSRREVSVCSQALRQKRRGRTWVSASGASSSEIEPLAVSPTKSETASSLRRTTMYGSEMLAAVNCTPAGAVIVCRSRPSARVGPQQVSRAESLEGSSRNAARRTSFDDADARLGDVSHARPLEELARRDGGGRDAAHDLRVRPVRRQVEDLSKGERRSACQSGCTAEGRKGKRVRADLRVASLVVLVNDEQRVLAGRAGQLSVGRRGDRQRPDAASGAEGVKPALLDRRHVALREG